MKYVVAIIVAVTIICVTALIISEQHQTQPCNPLGMCNQ